MENNIFNVIGIERHRLTTDGNGVTTLVGLSGCPLKCEYCINKEVLAKKRPSKTNCMKLLENVIQDYCYFVATNGGITFGGGESLLHYQQIKEFIKILPPNISINVETSLNVDSIAVESLLDDVTEWIIDIKDINPIIYEKYTQLSQKKVIKNLSILEEHNLQNKCTIRVPLIPNYNTIEDREKSIDWLHQRGFNNLDVFDYVIKK